MKPFVLNKIAQPTRDCRSHLCRGDVAAGESTARGFSRRSASASGSDSLLALPTR